MSPNARTSLKLGLFTLFAALAIAGAVLGLGLRLNGEGAVPYHTYFDESVQGLEVGAPVKYRGVALGRVDAIAIAPDRRHIDVTMSLDHRIAITPDLRAQLASQGITGVKLVNIDLFDPAAYPVPALPFPVAEDTIPAATSLIGSVEQSLGRTVDRLPVLLDAMLATLGEIRNVFQSLEREHVPETIAQTVTETSRAVKDLRAVLREVASARIPERTTRAIEDADQAMVKLGAVLDGLGGDGGVLAATKSAASSVDVLGRRVAGSSEDLDRALREVAEAARAVRELADAIDHDPDMLVKGRAPRRAR